MYCCKGTRRSKGDFDLRQNEIRIDPNTVRSAFVWWTTHYGHPKVRLITALTSRGLDRKIRHFVRRIQQNAILEQELNSQ